MKKPPVNIAHSVKQRLANIAAKRREDFQDILERFGTERILDRLSRSQHAEKFVLKGAQLFLIWTGQYYRSTRDMDLMASGEPDAQLMAVLWREICAVEANDGIEFDPASVTAEVIKAQDEYKGVRITLVGRLERTRVNIQIDVGFGDAITPAPAKTEFPALLDMPPPRLLVYPPETAIAEKFEAMVHLGTANTRMKDFYDLWIMSRHFTIEGGSLRKAMAATFARRRTEMPAEIPPVLTPDAPSADTTRKLWESFMAKGRFQESERDFRTVCDAIALFVMPVARAIVREEAFVKRWLAGGRWK